MNKKAPGYLIDVFEKKKAIVFIPFVRAEVDYSFLNIILSLENVVIFTFGGAKMCNSIPFNIKSATMLSAFKTHIDNLAVF